MNQVCEQLLFHEAYLLDSRRFQDWQELLSPELRYWAPVRSEIDSDEESESEGSRLPLFDETKASIMLRIARLASGLAWVERPPTRTRRFVSNVTAAEGSGGLVNVRSNLLLFRSRSFKDETLLACFREDQWLRASDSVWLLKERKILIDHCTVENMSLFL